MVFLTRTYTRFRAIGILFLTFLFLSVKGQTDYGHYKERINRANDYFHLLNYTEAIDIFKEVLEEYPGDTAILCKLGNSYSLLNKPEEAEEWYKMAIIPNESTISSKYIFELARVLTINSKYIEASYWYKKYHEKFPDDKRAYEAIQTLNNISGLYRDSIFYIHYSLPVNTPFSELAPRYYKDDLIFLSDRGNDLGFIARYVYDKDSRTNSTSIVKYNSGIKSQLNEGVVSFYNNYNQVIFSQNYLPDGISKRKIKRVPFKLYKANCDSSVWNSIQMLPFQEGDYSYSQPCMAESGKTLYFSSDKPGGFGGYDIYRVNLENNQWGEPQNMGSVINSSEDEIFPFIFRDSILFFSSNGHGGLGEQDLFRITINNRMILKNLGVPFNSPFDDFGLIIDNEGINGYFTSNRNNEKSGEDLFAFKQVKMSVRVKIEDQDKHPLSFIPVSYSDSSSISGSGVTDMDGIFQVIISTNKDSFNLYFQTEKSEKIKLVIKRSINFSDSPSLAYIKTSDNSLDKVSIAGNRTNPEAKDLVFKVQLFASRRSAYAYELKRKYRGNLKIEKAFENNWHKYTIGEFKTYLEAFEILKQSMVSDAFIAVYSNGKRISIGDVF